MQTSLIPYGCFNYFANDVETAAFAKEISALPARGKFRLRKRTFSSPKVPATYAGRDDSANLEPLLSAEAVYQSALGVPRETTDDGCTFHFKPADKQYQKRHAVEHVLLVQPHKASCSVVVPLKPTPF